MEKYIYKAKLERVVDGDTVDALIDLGFDTWVKKRIRYKGIDTWESRTKDLDEKKIRSRRKGAQQRAAGVSKFQTRLLQIKKSRCRKVRQSAG